MVTTGRTTSKNKQHQHQSINEKEEEGKRIPVKSRTSCYVQGKNKQAAKIVC